MNPLLSLMPKLFFSFADNAAGGGGGQGAAQGQQGQQQQGQQGQQAGQQGQQGGTPAQGQQQGGASGGSDENQTVPLATLIEERKQRQELRNELDALKATMGGQQPFQQQQPQFDMYGNPVQPVNMYQQQGYPQQMPQQMQMPMHQQMPQQHQMADPRIQELWENDPQRAVAMTVNQAVQNAISQYDRVNSSMEFSIQQAGTRHQDFKQYEPLVRQELMRVAPHVRANPQAIDFAYYAVKGRTVDQNIQQQQQVFNQNIQHGTNAGQFGGGGTGGGGQQQGNQGQATQEEMSVAAAMGLSVEDYLAQKK